MKRGFILGLVFGSLLLYFFSSSDVYALSFEQSMDSYSLVAIQNNTKLEDNNVTIDKSSYKVEGERAVNTFAGTQDLWKMLPSYRNYYTSVDNNYSLDVYTYHFNDGPALTGSNYNLTFNFAQNYNSSSDSSMVQFQNLIVYITSQTGAYVCSGADVSGVNRQYSCVVPANFDMSTYSLTFDFTDISYISEDGIPFGVSYKMNYGATELEPIPYVPDEDKPDNPNQGVEDAIGSLEDTITDDTVNTDSAGGFFEDFEDNDFGLSDIITLPLNFIESLTSNTCVPLTLPLPFVNQNLSLPCMSEIYSQYFGAFFSIYQAVTTGLIGYWVAVRIFGLVKGFKDPEDDKIEVMDL